METKTCSQCKREKSVSDFHKRGKSRRSYCISCGKKYQKSTEKNKAYKRAWYHANKDRFLDRHLKSHYGLSLKEFNELSLAQENKCGICGLECSRYNKLSVDHCHETNEVRGLICDSCNKGLGFFKDNPVSLREAANYLDKA